MRIELLYFGSCPNYRQAYDNLQAVMAELRMDATVERVEVLTEAEAQAQRFLGSPSIRIDGRDLEYHEQPQVGYSLRCRLYRTPDGVTGYPGLDLLRAALLTALQEGQ